MSIAVLLVEDDPQIGDGIAKSLRKAGYWVEWIQDGADAELALAATKYDLLVLDLGLPGRDGTELLTRHRTRDHATPVLVVTARDAVADRVRGLKLGADDYLVKPFHLDELLARVQALLRRNALHGPELRLGGLTLNPTTRVVTLQGTELSLSAREYTLLHVFIEAPGAVFSLAELAQRLQIPEERISPNAIEVHLHRLRRKLGGDWIRNVRGVGYKLVQPA